LDLMIHRRDAEIAESQIFSFAGRCRQMKTAHPFGSEKIVFFLRPLRLCYVVLLQMRVADS